MIGEVAYLRRTTWVLMNLVEFLMARIKKITRERQAIDTDLADAQNTRRKAREHWIDIQIDMVLKFWPEHKAKLELLRIDLHSENDTYCDALDDADRAIINRVTAALLNQGLDLEDRIDERLSQQSN
jgi:hypothetical protein